MFQDRWFARTAVLMSVFLMVPVVYGQTPTPTPAPPTPTPAPLTSAAATQTPTPLPQIERMEPLEVARGGGVTFTGQNFPGSPDDITVFLNGDKAGAASAVDKTKFSFVVPDSQPLGRYQVRVECNVNNRKVPCSSTLPNAMLTVFSEAGKSQPKITAVYPLVSYPENEVYGFNVLGEGFSSRPSDMGLLVNQNEIPVCWKDEQSCQQDNKGCKDEQCKPWGTVVSPQQINFKWQVPQQYQGGVQLQARVGQSYSLPFDVTLSRVGSTFPKIVSLIIVVALFAIVLWLVSRGAGRNVIAGRRYTILSALFLDKETDTFSLSRFQFFIWTAVGILAYLYLLLSRSLVQGKLEFVDVPGGLPGIILISAGTTVLAQGITRAKGPKGAGEIHPSLTDFVSTGGVVVPERFQFFIWTIVGAAVFVFLIFLHDPGVIKDLPKVPSGFLELMGVSSAGYLGGKIARRAGPVIDEIIAEVNSLELTLTGRNLSMDARFIIGDEEVRSDHIDNLKPEIIETDDEGEPNTGKVLLLKITTPEPEWLKDGAVLTIINPDGQKATWPYIVGPVVTDPIEVKKVADDVTLVVKGTNLSSKSKVTIESPEGTPFTDPITVVFKDPDILEITAKNLQSGVLIITNPDEISLRKPYTAP